MIIGQGLHAQVLRDGAAAVREHAGVLAVILLLAPRLELDPVRHGGEELLGQGENPLVLPGLFSAAWKFYFLSKLLAAWLRLKAKPLLFVPGGCSSSSLLIVSTSMKGERWLPDFSPPDENITTLKYLLPPPSSPLTYLLTDQTTHSAPACWDFPED